MELVDTEALELLLSSRELSKSVPRNLIPDSLSDSLLLNESEIPAMPKLNNSTKSPKHSKLQIPDKMAPEELANIFKNLQVFRCRSDLHHTEKIKILPDVSTSW